MVSQFAHKQPTRFNEPEIPQDLATKQYVDNAAGVVVLNAILEADGTPVNDSEVFVNIPEFIFAAEANTRYFYFINFNHTTNGTADIRFIFTIPSGATGIRTSAADWQTEVAGTTNSVTVARFVNSSTGGRHVPISGSFDIGVTAGNVQMQFTQQVATVVDTLLQKGATMTVIRAVD